MSTLTEYVRAHPNDEAARIFKSIMGKSRQRIAREACHSRRLNKFGLKDTELLEAIDQERLYSSPVGAR